MAAKTATPTTRDEKVLHYAPLSGLEFVIQNILTSMVFDDRAQADPLSTVSDGDLYFEGTNELFTELVPDTLEEPPADVAVLQDLTAARVFAYLAANSEWCAGEAERFARMGHAAAAKLLVGDDDEKGVREQEGGDDA